MKLRLTSILSVLLCFVAQGQTALDSLYLQAQQQFNKGDRSGALQIMDEIIKLKPTDSAFYYRAHYGFFIRDEEAVLLDLKKCLNKNRKNHKAYALRGYIFERTVWGEPKNSEKWKKYMTLAESDYNTAVNLNPYIGNYYYSRASIRMALGDFESALQDLNMDIYLRGDSLTYFTYYARGLCNYQLKDYIGVLQDGAKSLKLDYRSEFGYELVALAELALGYIEKACATYKKAKEFNIKFRKEEAFEEICK